MDRRTFINKTSAAGAGFAMAPGWIDAKPDSPLKHEFKLMYAPHFGMFKNSAGEDKLDQLQFMHDMGFKALEFNGLMEEPVDFQEKLGEKLRELNMTMGVFVILTGEHWITSLTTGEAKYVDNFVKTCERAVEVAARVDAKWMTVVPGNFERSLPIGIQTSNVIECLRRGAEVLEPHGLTMVLEPLSDNPNLFLRTAHQTYMICTAVNSPACKILYDVYHMQRNEGRLIQNIDWCWDHIAYIQVGDVPGRKEPTSGEINYRNLFKHIYDKGYRGIVGMEHGNLNPGKEGETALIEAYAEVDKF